MLLNLINDDYLENIEPAETMEVMSLESAAAEHHSDVSEPMEMHCCFGTCGTFGSAGGCCGTWGTWGTWGTYCV